MWQFRRSPRWLVLPLAGVALAASAPMLVAQSRGRAEQARQLFEWKGRVDRELRIAMRGREAWVQGGLRRDDGRVNDRGNGRGNGRGYGLGDPVVTRTLPREQGTVRARLENGRGDVDVIQQPNARNEYTAIVRVRDRSSGTDTYRVSAFWVDADYGRNNRDRPGDRDWPNDRDDGWDRGGNSGDRTVLRWTGRVDDGLEIRVQGNRVEYRTLSGKGERDVHAELSRAGLPRANAQLRVETWTGRGDVFIVEQPSQRNGYTAVIRVRDPQPSFGFYDFNLTWDNRYASRR